MRDTIQQVANHPQGWEKGLETKVNQHHFNYTCSKHEGVAKNANIKYGIRCSSDCERVLSGLFQKCGEHFKCGFGLEGWNHVPSKSDGDKLEGLFRSSDLILCDIARR